MALAVWLQRRRSTRLTLSSSLIWLATFAFVEALAIWGQAFIPIQRDYMDPEVIRVLEVVRGVAQVAAFVFLAQFGIRLMGWTTVMRRAVTVGSIAVAVAICVAAALAAGPQGWGVTDWEAAVVNLARYGLLVPASLLAAVGLWRQRAELGTMGMSGIKAYSAATAAVLVLYALVAGTIVGPGPLALPGVANSAGWFDLMGFPLSLLQALTGFVLAVLAVKLLEIFDAETNLRMESLERARAIAEERARFRRDLHDGTIQSIYAAGLHLEAVAIRCEDPLVRTEVREVVSDLNAVTDGIRDYIRALAQPPATAEGIAGALGELVSRFHEETGGVVSYRAEGVMLAGTLPEETGQHLEQILREALSNTARHAGPCKVAVTLVFTPDEMDLVVSDDGIGPGGALFGEGDGQGLRNMRERARRLGGRIVVEAAPGGGTRIALAVPLDSDEPASDPFIIDNFTEVTVR